MPCSIRRLGAALTALFALAAALDPRQRPPEDELIYFLLPDRFENGSAANDRGGLAGDAERTGFNPASKAYYNGGDLAGLARRLDYIQGLGATAIWLGPIFRNKPMQGAGALRSAGYHGYWITDFTDVDPHFGTRTELKALIDAAHARGLKVYLDIIVNHTADVIQYRECPPATTCPYRGRADYPFTRRGGLKGAPINDGFAGDDDPSPANFARLTRPDYAYTPYVPAGEAKTPAWLNDPILYHNRGDSTFKGESSLQGDFAQLDDLMTEHPRVVAGMIEIFGGWIDEYGVDGFRIDTARHVNPEFWRAFVPAMLARAAARGIPNFHIFGEVADPDPVALARSTRVDGLPAALDFAFQAVVTDVLARGAPTQRLTRLFAGDALYEGGEAAARRLPTFLGNHDMGRFAFFIRQANPAMPEAEVLARVRLGHALMLFARGVPTLYSGDEQGFIGDGGDQDAREPLFASRVASYNDNALLGSKRTNAEENFDPRHPLYRAIAQMAAMRAADPALKRGRQTVRADADTPGLFAFTRTLGEGETLVAYNTGTAPITAQVEVAATSLRWRAAHGRCAPAASAPGSYAVTIAPLDFIICRAEPTR